MKTIKCESCGHTVKVGNRRKKDMPCLVCGNPIKMKKPRSKKRASKKTTKKNDKKNTKTVGILKAFFKWSSENLTVGKVVKGGLILLVVGTLIRGALFG